MNEFFESGGELGGAVGRDEEAGDIILDGLGDAADFVGDDRQAVGRGFEVNEAEAFDAVAVIDARHREDVGAFVNGGEFVVGDVAEETHGEVGCLGGGVAEGLFVAFFALAADDPVFEAGAIGGREELEGFEG